MFTVRDDRHALAVSRNGSARLSDFLSEFSFPNLL